MQKRVYAAQTGFDKHGLIAQILVCSLLSAGIAGVLAAFSGSASVWIISTAEAVLLSAFIAVVRKKQLWSSIFHAGAVIICALLVLMAFGFVQRAMITGVNNGILRLNNAFEQNIMPIETNPSGEGALILLHCILTALTTMAVNYFVHKRMIIALAVAAIVFVALTLIFKLPGQLALIPLLFVGLVGCWSLCVTGGGRGLFIACGAAALVSVLGAVMLGASGFDGFDAISGVHETARDRIYELRYGSDSLPNGDLYKAGDMLADDKDTLEVTFDGEPQMLYLKGFTGSRLEENKWYETENDAYLGEWMGMLDYLRSSGFSIQHMYSEYDDADERETDRTVITVENKGADRRYVYLPFTAEKVSGAGVSEDKDLTTVSKRLFGTGRYSFTNIDTGEKAEMLSPPQWLNRGSGTTDKQKRYIENENVYRAFALDTYLDMDEDVRKEVSELFYESSDLVPEEMGVYAITSRIRSVLALVVDYTAMPAEPRDRDFVGWLLADYRKGNSAYYASAAVMAYRAAGIPARYAEGYLVSQEDVDTMNETGRRSITLSSKNAHSWVEIYREGLGWVNIEVTPGYYTPDMSMQEVIDMSKNINNGDDAGENGSEHFTDAMSRYSPQRVERPEEMNTGVRFLLYLALMAIIVLFAMYIRYVYLAYKKNDMTYGQSKPETTSYMLGYICEALRADGIEANPDNPSSFKQPMLDKYSDFTEPEFERVISLMRRSSYGGAKLKEHELRTIRVFMEKLYRNVYKGKGPIKAFVMKYVKII